ncbi:hypothetical protein ZWY2020_015424 [Hordeum vulgare]|nr:hypothetical protein ZWY2020_015424 [Hordeum vulgare]
MAAVSKVLEDDDLLTEILLHTIFPTTLVNSVIVCTRWLAHASDRAFLSRFREIHPPHLLGFYINKGRSTPQFIPIFSQPLELASVILVQPLVWAPSRKYRRYQPTSLAAEATMS